ncbi:adenylate/guanylate cyclase domain-containing protein [Oscillatoria sp. FACHB-1407]|uniref:adenylate/guanylate cyclase domain-containing protein n=1 Tax=Oscillatoria sp. FACHB-1407 TaxID=2692847 RepID=UPI0016874FA4|nr:adenylate/guanylate cyclase domain-containing protein [Oscillatoria sp. FACHB-1407]MBD2461964.1 adenylate/guanylate cyclase domain-containing protein [Oscillatoria sp. FACHB-1407]
MPDIYYLPDEQLVQVAETETILESSLCAGIPHTHVCGGSARCSTCRVWVLEGLEHCAPRNDAEESLAKRLQFDSRIRLACQTQVCGEGRVTVRRLALDVEDIEMIDQQVNSKTKLTSIGEEKQLAVLFADLRGFTTFSEALPAYDVIYVLNRYFKRMGRVIERYGGIINNYMGDGLMALFGVDSSDRAAERAVMAGVEMQKAMQRLNAYLDSLYHRQLRIGIGIHYGNVVIGAVGASLQSQRMTAIGDAVNFASRIEAANKTLGTTLLISEETYAQVKDLVSVKQQWQVEIPGKSGEYTLYEISAIAGLLPPLNSSIFIRQKLKPRSPSSPIQTFLSRLWNSLKRLIGLH